MDANNKSDATPAAIPALSLETNTVTGNSAKFDQKVVSAAPPSNQHSDELYEEVAKKEALKKQFIASQAMTGMAKPLVFRR
ncbi:hypothetical protein PHMEG_00030128 [Phytophthora megakarya]|uniref:Uncharacterized protein n=1 Tax=Phytophthora megakarya TaxID=4795 RepID=A0A225UZL3_9STRA|nr:hypothetical protein PHMEG_00030128 [Phytophthora megakarya]